MFSVKIKVLWNKLSLFTSDVNIDFFKKKHSFQWFLLIVKLSAIRVNRNHDQDEQFDGR